MPWLCHIPHCWWAQHISDPCLYHSLFPETTDPNSYSSSRPNWKSKASPDFPHPPPQSELIALFCIFTSLYLKPQVAPCLISIMICFHDSSHQRSGAFKVHFSSLTPESLETSKTECTVCRSNYLNWYWKYQLYMKCIFPALFPTSMKKGESKWKINLSDKWNI